MDTLSASCSMSTTVQSHNFSVDATAVQLFFFHANCTGSCLKAQTNTDKYQGTFSQLDPLVPCPPPPIYSETCANGHLYSETTCIKRPLRDVPKVSAQYNLTCIQRPPLYIGHYEVALAWLFNTGFTVVIPGSAPVSNLASSVYSMESSPLMIKPIKLTLQQTDYRLPT